MIVSFKVFIRATTLVAVGLISQKAHASEKLDGPGVICVLPSQIALGFGECGHTYRVDRSFDVRHWETIGTQTFWNYPQVDRGVMDTACERVFIDTTTVIPQGTDAVYYRYFELEKDRVVRKSKVTTIDITHDGPWAENYWTQ